MSQRLEVQMQAWRLTDAQSVEGKKTMAHQHLVKEWVYWTDDLTAQEFMDRSRAEGHATIGAAVDTYMVEIPGHDRAWAELNAEELEEIRDVLMSYLLLTRGVEWT
jgi:hypothetical protein